MKGLKNTISYRLFIYSRDNKSPCIYINNDKIYPIYKNINRELWSVQYYFDENFMISCIE